MRTTSFTFRQAVNAPETGAAIIVLVEISGNTLTEPIRVCNDGADIVSNGHLYVAYPFDITLPDDVEDGAPTARITIDNVDRALTAGIRLLTAPPDVRVMVILADDPDTIEIDFPDFKLSNLSYDALVIEGNITVEDYLNEPFPGDSFLPSTTPGMF